MYLLSKPEGFAGYLGLVSVDFLVFIYTTLGIIRLGFEFGIFEVGACFEVGSWGSFGVVRTRLLAVRPLTSNLSSISVRKSVENRSLALLHNFKLRERYILTNFI
jgi:hypothetical protein